MLLLFFKVQWDRLKAPSTVRYCLGQPALDRVKLLDEVKLLDGVKLPDGIKLLTLDDDDKSKCVLCILLFRYSQQACGNRAV